MEALRKKTLGILGGMGPLATAYFYSQITLHTNAVCDADHLNIIITSSAEIPDRTDFIMGKSSKNPTERMCRDAKTLAAAGAELIAVPCNTAHYFHDKIAKSVDVPVLNIIEETAEHVRRRGFSRAGILATEGTVKIGAYSRELAERGVECVTPPARIQDMVTSIIYDYVKAGRDGGREIFNRVADEMLSLGCDCIILGCTELPLAAGGDSRIIDSLDALAYAAITGCGAVTAGFSPEFMSAYGA